MRSYNKYKKQILLLSKKNKSYSEIAAIVGCSKSTVSYHLKNIRKFSSSELKKGRIYFCKKCGKEIYRRPSKKYKNVFCSQSCRSKYYMFGEVASENGRRSAFLMSELRRSKNEIMFASLCKEKFNNVLLNKPIFNGWDADVILPDKKIAILWNGKWHYEKITKKHSLKQVKQRDRLKIKEIKICGYEPYIIKDMGKYNPHFVKNQFDIFITKIAA